jgi:uncharacterized membrane protein (DUF4010 family)
MMPPAESALALAVATLGGAAVGVERQWSGHASGPGARFAGVRTFALLGALAGLSGQLWVWGAPALSAVLLSAASLLVAIGYFVASRHDVDATTEVAALVVVAAGAAAGVGQIQIASGVVAVTTVLLLEKSRLHDLVARADLAELQAAFRFAVMAVVILPLLPTGPFGPLGGVYPRQLWLLVLFFSGLTFAGHVARRAIGASRGYPIAGLLGGLVSSTSVTLSFARLSRQQPLLGRPLSQGVVAANTVIYLRVVLTASVLSPPLALALIPYVVAPFAAGMAATASGLWRARPGVAALGVPASPLQLRSALQMAVLFQVVLFIVYAVDQQFGSGGLLATAAVLGLNDTDALTLSMARGVSDQRVAVEAAAKAVAVGLLSNTCVKAGLAGTIGVGAFRRFTVAMFTAMATLLVLAVWWL